MLRHRAPLGVLAVLCTIATVLSLAGTSAPAQAVTRGAITPAVQASAPATRTVIDINCRTIVSGKVCVDMTKYTSGSTSERQWRLRVYPVQDRWIQPLEFWPMQLNAGGDGDGGWPVCASGTCPKFTTTKIGKWRPIEGYVAVMKYRSASGANTLAAGKQTIQNRRCTTTGAGKVCATVINRLRREESAMESVFQVYPRDGRWISPISQRLYGWKGERITGRGYCTDGCKKLTKSWSASIPNIESFAKVKAKFRTSAGPGSVTGRP